MTKIEKIKALEKVGLEQKATHWITSALIVRNNGDVFLHIPVCFGEETIELTLSVKKATRKKNEKVRK